MSKIRVSSTNEFDTVSIFNNQHTLYNHQEEREKGGKHAQLVPITPPWTQKTAYSFDNCIIIRNGNPHLDSSRITGVMGIGTGQF